MKKQLSSFLLAFTIFSLNAMPAKASTSNLNNDATNKTLMVSGQWCFELPWMGLLCYDL